MALRRVISTAQSALTAIPPKSGNYFYPASGTANGSSTTLGNGSARALPWFLEASVTITKMAVDVTSAGDAGAAKLRLGIYADTGAYYPGGLLVDAGQVAADAVAMVEATINLTLARGIYWIVSCVQGVTTTQPGIRTVTGWIPPINLPIGTTLPAANGTNTGNHYSVSGVTGAFPSTFAGGGVVGATVPRVLLKAA